MKKRPPREWAPEEDRKLSRLWLDGVSVADICRILDRPLSSMNKRINYLMPNRELRRKRTPRWKLDFIEKHYAKPGWTRERIADHLNMRPGTLNSIAKRLGIQHPDNRPTKPKPKKTQAEIFKLVRENKSALYIATQTGCSETYVRKLIYNDPYYSKIWQSNAASRRRKIGIMSWVNRGKGKVRHTVKEGIKFYKREKRNA